MRKGVNNKIRKRNDNLSYSNKTKFYSDYFLGIGMKIMFLLCFC